MAEGGSSPDNRVSMSTASDALDILCNPCDNSGDIIEADCYCTECKQYLCTACLKYHKNVNSTKDHKLLTKDFMPRPQSTSAASFICTQPCQTHPDEVINYFCPTHNTLGCNICMTPTHDKCRRKVYIPDEAKNLAGSKELNFVQTSLAKMSTESDKVLHYLQTNLKVSADFRITALEKIVTYRQKMNDELDVLTDKIEDIAKRDHDKLNSAADQASKVKAELQNMATEIKTLLSQNKNSQVYIEMKTAESKLSNLQQQLDAAGSTSLTAFRFQPSEGLQKLMNETNALGEVITKNIADMRVTHVADLKAKAKGNKKACLITGCTVLSPTRLAVTDWENETVKLIDTERQRVISEYKPESCPNDVTTMKDRLAMTLTASRKIIFMKAEDKLRLDKEIHVDHQCCYISYTDDQLVVGCRNPPAVRLLNMSGQLLQTFSTSSTGEPLFSCSPRVTVSPTSGAIYACDWEAHRVMRLDVHGSVEATFSGDDMESPSYTAIDEMGCVFVTGANSDTVHVLTPGCSKVKVILMARDGIKWPHSVCYCRQTRKIYVGMDKNDIVKVYQLS